MLRRRFSSGAATKILDVDATLLDVGATLLDAAAITPLTLQRRFSMLVRRFLTLQRLLL
jgi:hypothetical protein